MGRAYAGSDVLASGLGAGACGLSLGCGVAMVVGTLGTPLGGVLGVRVGLTW